MYLCLGHGATHREVKILKHTRTQFELISAHDGLQVAQRLAKAVAAYLQFELPKTSKDKPTHAHTHNQHDTPHTYETHRTHLQA
jgi:hypothetical protein